MEPTPFEVTQIEFHVYSLRCDERCAIKGNGQLDKINGKKKKSEPNSIEIFVSISVHCFKGDI